MIVFINGSINAGKTTTGRELAKRLDATFLDFDDISAEIPDFSLATDLPKVFAEGIKRLKALDEAGKDTVAVYVVRRHDYDRMNRELGCKLIFFTLAPPLEVALQDRGKRKLNDWERERIKYHYDTGVPTPDFGHIIDNGSLSLDETVTRIVDVIENESTL